MKIKKSLVWFWLEFLENKWNFDTLPPKNRLQHIKLPKLLDNSYLLRFQFKEQQQL